MSSPFTGNLKYWDGVTVSALSKSHNVSKESALPVVNDLNRNIYMLKPGLLEVVSRGSKALRSSTLTLDEKCEISLSVGDECIQHDELRSMFEKKRNPICYDGFEPSGRMHIAQGLLKALNVNKLTACGCICVFWIADFFAMLNNKLGGDLKKIHKVGLYFIEVWKSAGMDLTNVRFLWTSEEIERDPSSYWMRVMDIAKRNSISRMKRCSQIMGRGEGDDQPCANILYPCMQCADIFYIGADICQLGMDQRKVNMLAREYVDDWNSNHKKDANAKMRKPIILSHGMMPGLMEGQLKMSKSDPNSAIFMDDSQEEVRRKLKRAFCPPCILEGNPAVTYAEKIIFGVRGHFEVKRSEANGGNVTYNTVESFKEAYQSGTLHPADLKSSLAEAINGLLQPVRDHFTNNLEAKKLLSEVRAFKTQ